MERGGRTGCVCADIHKELSAHNSPWGQLAHLSVVILPYQNSNTDLQGTLEEELGTRTSSRNAHGKTSYQLLRVLAVAAQRVPLPDAGYNQHMAQIKQQKAAGQHLPSFPAPRCGRHACTGRRTPPLGASARSSRSSRGYGTGGRRLPDTCGTGPCPTCRQRSPH